MTADSVPTTPPGPSNDGDTTTVDDTAAAEGPVEGPGAGGGLAPAERRRRRRRWFWTGFTLLVLTGMVGALFIPTPYYLLEPGSVRPAEQRIDVEGARSYDTPGDVLFTTVLIDQATLGGLVRGALDDAIVVKDEEEIYGGQDRKQSQQVNQQRMDLSKLIATKVGLEYVGFPASFTANGAKVLGLTADSPSKGVLRPGDVITGVDGATVRLPSDIADVLADRAPGDAVPVTVRRTVGRPLGTGDQAGSRDRTTTVDTSVTLGAAEEDRTRPVLGVLVDPDDPTIDSPVSVDIDSGKVTGPSAGLAWALAVVDRLTPGSLTDGRDVAVTGEMLPDGTVGQIGGIVQKVSAVRRAGVDLFLYPAATPKAEQRQMREVAGDDVELRPVATLEEAVAVLAPEGVRKVGSAAGGTSGG